MRKLTHTTSSKAALILTSCAMLIMPTVQAEHWSGNLSAKLGEKSLDKDDWQSFDSQGELAIMFDIKKEQWPVSLVYDITLSADTESGSASFSNKEKGGAIEQHIGIRKIFDNNGGSISPYIGGGLAQISARLDKRIGSDIVEMDDTATGLWVGVGTYWHVSKKLNVGFDIRYSQAEVTLFNQQIEAGGLHTGISIGTRW
jgi:opacity protein-like surface antigen